MLTPVHTDRRCRVPVNKPCRQRCQRWVRLVIDGDRRWPMRVRGRAGAAPDAKPLLKAQYGLGDHFSWSPNKPPSAQSRSKLQKSHIKYCENTPNDDIIDWYIDTTTTKHFYCCDEEGNLLNHLKLKKFFRCHKPKRVCRWDDLHILIRRLN